jgi:hypothetical protein
MRLQDVDRKSSSAVQTIFKFIVHQEVLLTKTCLELPHDSQLLFLLLLLTTIDKIPGLQSIAPFLNKYQWF